MTSTYVSYISYSPKNPERTSLIIVSMQYGLNPNLQD